MRIIPCLFLAAVSISAAACGGGGGDTGGVGGSKKLVDLTPADYTALCNANLDNYPPKTVSCPDGDSQTVGLEAEDCADTDDLDDLSASCAATVDDYLDCQDAIYNQSDADQCGNSFPSECNAFIACFSSARTVQDLRAFVASRTLLR